MALNDVIARFKTGTYTVTRMSHGTYVNGLYVPGSATSLTIEASIQPASGRHISALPEGQRAEETRIVWTKTRLRTREDGAPDTVLIGSENYTVIDTKMYQGFRGDGSGDCYEIMVAKQGVP